MTLVIDGTEYLPAASVAQQLGTTELKVLMLIKQRALTGDLFEGTWYISSPSLESLDPGSLTAPTPAGCASCTGSECGCH